MMATYYARLTQIFTRSEARLYNAYAWYRLFTFSRSFNKGLTQDDLVAMASNVVLSALSVLPYDRGNTAARGYDIRPHEKENSARMAAILGFNVDRLDRRVLLSRQVAALAASIASAAASAAAAAASSAAEAPTVAVAVTTVA